MLTAKELFQKRKGIYTEIGTLEDDVKALKDEHKEADFDVALIASLAKAAAAEKLGKVEAKATATLELIESLT